MIPRFKPYLGKAEILAAIRAHKGAVESFEEAFARSFEAKYAVSFSYGRSALWAFLKAMDIEGAEVILPAYTCVVVAHSTVLSGNIPRFVDISLHDYNMDLDEVEAAITGKTRVILATHLFGYPLNVDKLAKIVQAAEKRYGHKIWVVQDCAHAFGARWQGKLVCNEGDAALYGLNISKTMNSVFGGMITTNNIEFYKRLRSFRESHFLQPHLLKRIRRLIYLATTYFIFNKSIYSLVNWLEEETLYLEYFTKSYHLDGLVRFPPDYLNKLLDLEAEVGLVQLEKYQAMVDKRKKIVRYYDGNLKDLPGLVLPPLIEGATYSHYVFRVKDRALWIKPLRKAGIQLGELINYSIPEIPAYRKYSTAHFPNSHQAMKTTLNLPLYYALDEGDLLKIVQAMHSAGVRIFSSQPNPL